MNETFNLFVKLQKPVAGLPVRFLFPPGRVSFAKNNAMRREGRTHLSYPRCGGCGSAAHILISFLLSCCPVLLFSCEASLPEEPCKTQIYIHKKSKTTAETLDLFFFNDDALRTLDSYQRFNGIPDGLLEGASRSGDKIVAAVANLSGDIYSWSDIHTFQRLSERVSDLVEDHPERPVMSGLCTVRAGKQRRAELPLEPLMSRVCLHSLCSDFHARPYRDAVLEDIDIYLVNVNRTVNIFDNGSATVPSSWLNLGGKEDDGLSVFHISRLEGTLFPDMTMYCYPNSAHEESLGRPQTRLVVEATLNGQRYWYPVNLPALGRNQTVLVDLTITRTGTTDPDSPAETGTVLCETQVVPWHEMDDYAVLF